jgi:hypothetical protein
MMRWGELEIRIREQERVKRVEETEMWKGWERNTGERSEGDEGMKGTRGKEKKGRWMTTERTSKINRKWTQ